MHCFCTYFWRSTIFCQPKQKWRNSFQRAKSICVWSNSPNILSFCDSLHFHRRLFSSFSSSKKLSHFVHIRIVILAPAVFALVCCVVAVVADVQNIFFAFQSNRFWVLDFFLLLRVTWSCLNFRMCLQCLSVWICDFIVRSLSWLVTLVRKRSKNWFTIIFLAVSAISSKTRNFPAFFIPTPRAFLLA